MAGGFVPRVMGNRVVPAVPVWLHTRCFLQETFNVAGEIPRESVKRLSMATGRGHRLLLDNGGLEGAGMRRPMVACGAVTDPWDPSAVRR